MKDTLINLIDLLKKNEAKSAVESLQTKVTSKYFHTKVPNLEIWLVESVKMNSTFLENLLDHSWLIDE